MTCFVIMGVAGSGKSTIGAQAAARLRLPFIEADDFHSIANKAKMAGGTPLTDADRAPWIDALCDEALRHDSDSVMSCSALTQFVRDRLRAGLRGKCRFIYLRGSEAVIAQRLQSRTGHFFNPSLLSSQFAALGEPDRADILDINHDIETLVAQSCAIIKSAP